MPGPPKKLIIATHMRLASLIERRRATIVTIEMASSTLPDQRRISNRSGDLILECSVAQGVPRGINELQEQPKQGQKIAPRDLQGVEAKRHHALYSVNQFKRAIIAVLQRLRGLAPAAIENGVRGRNARRGRCILASHDADQDVDRGSGVTSRQRADFGEGFGHAAHFHPSERGGTGPSASILQCTMNSRQASRRVRKVLVSKVVR